ncbi:MAG: ArsR/SmtB family transcription factor [Anaerolineae bacterium]
MPASNVIEFCRALSDETRQKILETLQQEGELCVNDLVACFSLSQPTISHHLNFLKKANLVTSRREGKQILYRINQENVVACCGILFTKILPADMRLVDAPSTQPVGDISG